MSGRAILEEGFAMRTPPRRRAIVTVAGALLAWPGKAVMRLLPVALVVLGLPKAAAAQPPKGHPAVTIDFRALTDEGQQVTDLKPDEVALKVNGKPRRIHALGVFNSVAADPSPGASALPPPYATNAVGHSGRVIHVLIDDDSITPGREGQVRDAMRLLVSELAPGDVLGVLTTQGQVNFRPSSDLVRVQRAVDGMAGRSGAHDTHSDAQCRTTRGPPPLGSILALTGGTPTTIVIFSGGLSPPAQKIINVRSRAAAGTNDVCPVRPEDFENIGILASSARADLYLFHLTEAMASRSSAQDAGFESLAGVTGAELVRLSAGPH